MKNWCKEYKKSNACKKEDCESCPYKSPEGLSQKELKDTYADRYTSGNLTEDEMSAA
jgi:hypothetical protein